LANQTSLWLTKRSVFSGKYRAAQNDRSLNESTVSRNRKSW